MASEDVSEASSGWQGEGSSEFSRRVSLAGQSGRFQARVQVLLNEHDLRVMSSTHDESSGEDSSEHYADPTETRGTKCTATSDTENNAAEELGYEVNPPPPALAGYGAIDRVTARRVAGGATHWEMIRQHPDTGTIVVDRYRPSEQMRRLLGARDMHCRFPGCRVPLARCDIDHTVDAASGGPTSTDNLAHLCRGHHTLKHHTGWRVRQAGDGDLEWTSPTGRRRVDRPESRVRFVPTAPRNTEEMADETADETADQAEGEKWSSVLFPGTAFSTAPF